MVNQDEINKLVDEWGYLLVAELHGASSQHLFHSLLNDLRLIYRYVEPSSCGNGLVVFISVGQQVAETPSSGATDFDRASLLHNEVQSGSVIQVFGNGRFRLWKRLNVNLAALSNEAFVYHYTRAEERLLAAGQSRTIPRVFSYPSIFAVPTFDDLNEALEHYKVRMARFSTCTVLDSTWFDKSRLFFKSGQEFAMRDSLTNHLVSTFRGDVEVRREQNVNASKPVDIKVTWFMTNRTALIEIKWLGDSKKTANGKVLKHRDSRARSGAKQLADYLDKNRQNGSANSSRGYLVVFDGRRHRLKKNSKTISRVNGLHFHNKDIKYSTKYHQIRDDFEQPVRFFIEPICDP